MFGKLLGVFLFLLIFKDSVSVRVNIYYETFNENARKFMVEQLTQLDSSLEQFGENLQVRYYPYGNTSLLENGVAVCNRGDGQCRANSIHMCALADIMAVVDPDNYPHDDYDGYQKELTSSIACFFKNRFNENDPLKLGKICDMNPSLTCLRPTGATIKELNQYFADKSKGVSGIESGFAVQFDDGVVEGLKTNLIGEICKKLGSDIGNTIEACKNPQNLVKQTVSIFYEANDLKTGKYFNKQLFQYYHVLEDFVDLELVPFGNISINANYECEEEGKTKCMSTLFQAMVVDKYMKIENGGLVSGPNRVVSFVDCLFHQDASTNVFISLKACADETLETDEFENIIGLMKNKEGDFKRVVDAMRQKTEQARASAKKPVRFPYVKLDGAESIAALNDVVLATCTNYKGGVKPNICTKVQINVLYSPLDHNTRTIFLEYLRPLFDNMQNVINFTFVPAGKTQLNSGGSRRFDCAPEQCEALKFHGCIIDNYWNDGEDYNDPIRQEVFDAVQCMFKNKLMKNVSDNVVYCAEIVEADIGFSLLECFKNEGDSILGENIKDTDAILSEAGLNVDTVMFPAFIYNGKKLVKAEDLRGMVCDNFDKYHKPDFCLKDRPEKVKVRVFYQSDSELSKSFFTTQYDPWYLYLEEMLDVELIVGGNSNDGDGQCDSLEADSTCLANKIQAFVIDTYSKNPNSVDWLDGTMRTMHFLRCVFSHPLWKVDFLEASSACGESELGADEDFDLIPSAIADKSIYREALRKTREFLMSIQAQDFNLLPWVTIGQDGNSNHSKRAANDLLQTVCSLYEGDKPPECTPVNVEVYYSGFHPQSRRFFVDELIPVYRNLRERIHLDLIPYGPISMEDPDCQTSACQVNKHQACAIKMNFADEIQDDIIQFDGKNQTLSYVHCMFKNVHNFDVATLSEECANQYLLLADEVHQCAQGEDGKDALHEMRQKTANLMEEMEHAPWIVINGKRIAAAQHDLRTEICAQMIGDRPDYCVLPRAPKVAIQFHYSALDDNAKKYVLSELYPNYRFLEEIIDLDLVAIGQCEVLNFPDESILTCENGVHEEHAVRIHACVHDIFWDNDNDPISDNNGENEYDGRLQVVEFLRCYFASNDYPDKPEEAAERCVEDIYKDIWSEIHNCATGPKSLEILSRQQKEKVEPLRPSITYTPWITINGIHNYAVESHITRTVCDAYKGREKPQTCHRKADPVEKPLVEVHYEINDRKSMPFFTKFLNPEKSFELANLQLVPFGRSTYQDKKFTCINDPECHLYREHACLIDLFYKTEPIRTIRSIACTFNTTMMEHPNVVNECVNQEFDDEIYDDIITCAKDFKKSDALLEASFNLTSALPRKISHSPWIVIDQEHNLEAEKNILDELCSVYYPSDKPDACKIDLLPVGVYYETISDGSVNFFRDHFEEYVQYVNEIGQFDYVPFGSASIDADGNIQCSSTEQCHLNTIHACVIDIVNKSPHQTEEQKILDRIRLGEFLVCTFTSITPTRNTAVEEQCANKNLLIPDVWEEIHDCARSDRGKQLMIQMRDKTQNANVGPKFPQITINNSTNEQALEAFFAVLCDSYDTIRPPLCRTIKNLGTPTGIFFSGNKESRDMFNRDLKPLYQYIISDSKYDDEDEQLYRLISPDLVPWGKTTYDENNAENPFKCPTPEECRINRLFACAISAHRNEPRSSLHLMEFAICFFNEENALTDPLDAAEKCTDLVWIPDPFPDIRSCATSNDQADYNKLLAMKRRTENLLPSDASFPAITINNMYETHATNGYLNYYLCTFYKGIDRPDFCTNVDAPPTTPIPSTISPPTGGPPSEGPPTGSPPSEGPPTGGPPTDGPSTESPPTDGPPISTTPKPGSSASSIFSYTIFVLIGTILLLSYV